MDHELAGVGDLGLEGTGLATVPECVVMLLARTLKECRAGYSGHQRSCKGAALAYENVGLG